ncbi:late competence protein ComER [Salipaludibacillus keqinensis]|uniref:Pyrroline-5-carboxylate reductase n=1 Tax=Salipaludibacillus keqinensis TaxID=2045207 RepID=A0A323TJU1_9BACI|nr:late competence protein ComER [Salipaludibacillus keqinensis]PYZ94224.1 late competence protein ComER [Salipaludibacillus keqinensis]
MKKLGFIGTGSMGGLIIEAFIKGGQIKAEHIHMTNRTLEKAKQLQLRHKKTVVHHDIYSVINHADWIFICTKPMEMVHVLKDISNLLRPDQVVITITSPLQVEESEQILNKQAVVRFIPSIVNLSLEGPSLITYSNRCSSDLRDELTSLFSSISNPVTIDPSITRVASDIASCGPAFISFLIERMIKGAVDETKIDEKTATIIAESMLIGFGELLKQKHFDLATLRKRVTVPGGVTGVGLKVLQNETGWMFHELFRETEKKYVEDRQGISKQLNNKGS